MSIFNLFRKFCSNTHKSSPEHFVDSSEEVKTITTPFGKGVVKETQYPSEPMLDMSDKSEIVRLAIRANWKHNTGQSVAEVWSAINDLYRYVQTNTGKTLINLPAVDCATVGKAFAIYALCYVAENGDRDFNSVAAENAFYCLMRSFKENDNEFVIPTLFSILNGPEDLLQDRFIAFRCDDLQREIGVPIGMILKGNPYHAPHLADFREQSINFRLIIMRYLLDFFYDIEQQVYKQPTDLLNFLPSKDAIDKFLICYNNSAFANVSDYTVMAKKYIDGIYISCEDVLNRY